MTFSAFWTVQRKACEKLKTASSGNRSAPSNSSRGRTKTGQNPYREGCQTEALKKRKPTKKDRNQDNGHRHKQAQNTDFLYVVDCTGLTYFVLPAG